MRNRINWAPDGQAGRTPRERLDDIGASDDLAAIEAEAAAESQEDVQADPSPATDDGAEPAADGVTADSPPATETEPTTGDEALPFGKHPRWKQVQDERNQARQRAEAAEAERDRLRQEADQARTENARLSHLHGLDARLSRDPEA